MASAPGAAVVWPQPAQIYADLFKLFKAFEACGYKWRCSVYGWSENVHGLQNSFTASPVLLPCSGAPSVPVPGLLRRLRALPRAVPPVSAGSSPVSGREFPVCGSRFPVLGSIRASNIGPNARWHWGGCKVAFGRISPGIGADFTHAAASAHGKQAFRNGIYGSRHGAAAGAKRFVRPHSVCVRPQIVLICQIMTLRRTAKGLKSLYLFCISIPPSFPNLPLMTVKPDYVEAMQRGGGRPAHRAPHSPSPWRWLNACALCSPDAQ